MIDGHVSSPFASVARESRLAVWVTAREIFTPLLGGRSREFASYSMPLLRRVPR